MKKQLCTALALGLLCLSTVVADSAFADGDTVGLSGVVYPTFVATYSGPSVPGGSPTFEVATTSTNGVTIEVIPISVDAVDGAETPLPLEIKTFVSAAGTLTPYEVKSLGVSAGVIRIIVSDN
jgi:hypothetical protein